MTWSNPLPGRVLVPSGDGKFYQAGDGPYPVQDYHTCIPLTPHLGAFAAERTHHTHEGVDLYCPEGWMVVAVEAGTVVEISQFTGEGVGSPWWEDTQAVLVEGKSGVVVYGEIEPWGLTVGDDVVPGDVIGFVKRVLKVDKGRPMSMLHLELHQPGTRIVPAWESIRPYTLLDPTPHLLKIKTNGQDRLPG